MCIAAVLALLAGSITTPEASPEAISPSGYAGAAGFAPSSNATNATNCSGIEFAQRSCDLQPVGWIHLNETKGGNVTVHNGAPRNVSVHFDIQVIDPFNNQGWSAKFKFMELELGPDQGCARYLDVTGPRDGNPGDYMDIFINATVDNSTSQASIIFRIYLDVTVGLRLSCPYNIHTASSKYPSEYSLMLENTGDVTLDLLLNYSIMARGCTVPDVRLDRTLVTGLRGYCSDSISMLVTPPESAWSGEVYYITVLALAVGKHNASANITTHTVVSSRFFFDMSCNEGSMSVDPGKNITFPVEVSSHGNLNETILFVLDDGVNITGPCISIEPDTIELVRDDVKHISVTLRCPDDAPAGMMFWLRICGFDDSRMMYSDVFLQATVNTLHDMDVSLVQDRIETGPGTKGAFTVMLRNRGNKEEALTLGAPELHPGWSASYWRARGNLLDASISNLTLQPGEFTGIGLLVTVPDGARCAPHRLQIPIQDASGHSWSLDAYVSVKRHGELLLNAPVGERTAGSGSVVEFPISMENRGNTDETLSLSIEGLPTGFIAKTGVVRADSITLVPGGQLGTNISVKLPSDFRTALQEFSIRTVTQSGIVHTAKFSIHILAPDLLVSDVSFGSGRFTAGKAAHATVTVDNRGTFEAEAIRVSLLQNGHKVASGKIAFLSAGTRGTVDLVWNARAGAANLTLLVDPENTITESDEDNNLLEPMVPSAKEPAAQDGPSSPHFNAVLWAAMALLLSLLPCMAFVSFLRGRPAKTGRRRRMRNP